YDPETLRVLMLAWVGLFGLPFYYLIWTYVFPQPYGNLTLYAIGMGMCLLVVAGLRSMPQRWRMFVMFAAVTYTLPFLFTFMYLMNTGSPVWSQSMLMALVLLFHFRLRWALASYLAGASLAVAACSVAHGEFCFVSSRVVLEQFPVCAFTVLVIAFAKVGRRMLAQEKMSGMAQGLATVSHELRTPLVSVDANVRGMMRMLARDQEDPAALRDALSRIQFEVRHMNHLVDLFLLSATAVTRTLDATEMVPMSAVIHNVMKRYPFASSDQRDAVRIEIRSDFSFGGQHELAVVIFLNLLRNAFKALHRAGKGRVRIVVDGARRTPRVLFIDTGCGIASAELPHIYQRFYTYPPGSGSGIGLTLCKDIMDAWHASIRCLSREHAYTMFVLEFPANPKLAPRPATRFDTPPLPCPYPSTSTPA
ncbi:MAG TPA: HAMP domain-containing sensor histidine kinase, partial [Telluria sp.]|nr:HAMP domain-containing sensor histidine kinase [Telluria sp.]